MKQKLLNSIRLRVAMLVAVLCAVFTGTAWGTDVTTTFASGSNYSTNMDLPCDNGGLTWKTSAKPNSFESSGSARGIQYSKVSTDLTTTISGVAITKVEVVASTNANANANSISVYVGNSQIGSTQNMPKENNATYTFEDTGKTGEIKVTISNDGTKSTYVKSIKVTYVATHTLTYSATNGSIGGVVSGTSTAVASGASVAEGGKVTLTAQPAVGYVFNGWSDGGNNSTLSSTTDNPTTFTMGTANATVTANFVASGTPIKYSVTYNANGATSGSVPTDENEYDADAEVTVKDNTGSLAKTGNAFSGWNTQADGLGTDRAAGSTFNITANTTLYAKWTPYTITAASSNNSHGTVELNESVITATPVEGYTYAEPAYMVTSGSATVVQNGNEFTVTPTSDCTVTINFEAIPTHNVSFSVNGTVDNANNCIVAEGAAITFPSNPADFSGKKFVGWATATISGTTNSAPTFVTSAKMGTSDIIYYAVFADVTPGDATSTTKTITTSTTNIPTAYGTANTFSEYTFEGIKFMVQQMYLYNSKLQWRAGGNNNGTGTMYNEDELSNLQSVVLTYDGDNNKNFTLMIGDSENPTSGTSITPSVSQENENEYTYDCSSYKKSYFVLANGDGAGYLASIAITYLVGTPDTYSNYCTTVANYAENAITGIDDSYTVDLAKNESQVNLSGATATSGATVLYEVTSSTIDAEDYELTNAGVLTVTGNGVIEIRAYVNGDAQYEAAEKTVTVTVKANPVIGYAGANETTAFGSNYTVDESLIDGGAVTLESGNDEIATVSDLVVTPVAVGSVTITVTTEATDIWHAGSATFTLNITAPEGSVTAPTSEVVVFNETFAKCKSTGGNDTDGWSGTIANGTLTDGTNTDNSGWDFTTGNAANGCAKFGSGKNGGSAVTPELTLESNVFYTLTFKAAAWNTEGEGTTLELSATNASFYMFDETYNKYVYNTSTSVTLVKGAWTSYTLTVVADDASQKANITFSTTGGNSRFFLDDVKLTQNNPPTATVKLNKYGYATYCSPNPIDFSSTTGYTAWRVSGISGSTITFEKITGKIKGGQGVLLYNNDADGENTSDVTINFADGTTVFSDSENLLYGTTASTYAETNQYYGLKGDTFVPVAAGTVPAGKALLPVSAVPSEVKSLTFSFDIADGIKSMDNGQWTMDNGQLTMDAEAIFNLAGQRLSKPQRGINIVNGKKVLVK